MEQTNGKSIQTNIIYSKIVFHGYTTALILLKFGMGNLEEVHSLRFVAITDIHADGTAAKSYYLHNLRFNKTLPSLNRHTMLTNICD